MFVDPGQTCIQKHQFTFSFIKCSFPQIYFDANFIGVLIAMHKIPRIQARITRGGERQKHTNITDFIQIFAVIFFHFFITFHCTAQNLSLNELTIEDMSTRWLICQNYGVVELLKQKQTFSFVKKRAGTRNPLFQFIWEIFAQPSHFLIEFIKSIKLYNLHLSMLVRLDKP